jgi:hypothetical protein
MKPEEQIRNLVKYYVVTPLSKGGQDFYDGPCAEGVINNLTHEDELVNLISSLISHHQE